MTTYPLAEAICADVRVQGLLHRLFDALCVALEKRQFLMLDGAEMADASIAFGHRVELHRMVADHLSGASNSFRKLHFRLAYRCYSASFTSPGRSELRVELRDTAFLGDKTFSPRGSEARAVVLSLPHFGAFDEQSLDIEPHVTHLLAAAAQGDQSWVTPVAQRACEDLCSALAP